MWLCDGSSRSSLLDAVPVRTVGRGLYSDPVSGAAGHRRGSASNAGGVRTRSDARQPRTTARIGRHAPDAAAPSD
ncbi:hypothetical protein AO398_23940 [Methylobacterium sp. GXS13]|jgi:hypothetical protein|nr:hypothetical protein AO398_23940 [Methylobacterium sp. GXS13]